MIIVNNEDLKLNHQLYLQAYKSSRGSLTQEKFMSKSFPIIEAQAKRQYPYEVKIPKPMELLLQGDFEPAYTLTIKDPINGLWSNIWFGDASSGAYLRSGYVDGNSSLISDQKLGDANIHMFLGGSTGQGKSVTLNALIFGLCNEYAPWEVALTLCDPKIVEFKPYALKYPMPHIRSVAATSDVDYLISVLNDLKEEMQNFNSVMAQLGISKIEDFRKATGLNIPQNIIVADEFQTLFKYAGRKRQLLESIFDEFARLGRSTGYHLLLASQELSSDIPSNTWGNIQVRAAMGCLTPEISTKILGNDGAVANMGKKGRMIYNLNPANADKKDNIMVVVPFLSDKDRQKLGLSIVEAGKKIGYSRVFSFYDEQKQLPEEMYTQYLQQFKQTSNRFLLGEPSFVMKDKEQVVKLDFTGSDIENICILTGSNLHLQRYFKMLKKNLELFSKDTSNILLIGDRMYTNTCKARELPNVIFAEETKEFKCNTISLVSDLIARRKLMLDVDARIFSGSFDDSDTRPDEFYRRLKLDKTVNDVIIARIDTATMWKRYNVARGFMLNNPTYRDMFKIDSVSSKALEDLLYKQIRGLLLSYDKSGCSNQKVTYQDLSKVFVWILGANKLIGLGRDSKVVNVNALKKLLQDCSDLNIRFIIFTTTMEDIADLRSGIRWFIIDDVPLIELTKIKVNEFYPEQKSKILGVLYNSSASDDKCVKFKKMSLSGELLL